ncbi:MAG: hypothetical protein ED559_09140 [Phycisphaera sp.]|nr:MAG: hypothetical protein ED559_09140 [Phycisphaera sp.]
MHVRRTIGLAVLSSIGLVGLPALAQDAAPAQPEAQEEKKDLPKASDVFDRHIEALGGLDAIKAIDSRRLSGRIKIFAPGNETPSVTGILRLAAKAPDKIVQEIIIPGQSTQKRVFDGKAGWLVVDDGEPTPLTGEDLERFTVSSRFYAEADYETHFKSIETVDVQDTPQQGRVVMVRVDHHSGRAEAYLFSEDTGLLVAVVGQRQTPQGQAIQFQRTYENYTEFNGMKFSMLIRELAGGQIIELEFSDVENNVADFPEIERPANILDADISGFQKSE